MNLTLTALYVNVHVYYSCARGVPRLPFILYFYMHSHTTIHYSYVN